MTGEPFVSICLPNLNTRPFLEERLETILGQTYRNWELIVVDGYSEDGAWEFFQRLAQQDQRVSIGQAPRGLYEGWNSCLRRARGKYVYFATSDDTMARDCLEKMVANLERHQECDLAQCTLVLIDKNGAPIRDLHWPDYSISALGLGELAHRYHIRRAPYDGLIHLLGVPVANSITELLVRRSLFSRTGFFNPRWGSLGDFNWEMKAGLLGDTIHVPDTWASFRIHPAQASQASAWGNREWHRKMDEMMQDAFEACQHLLAPEVVEGVSSHWLGLAREMRRYYAGLRLRATIVRRRLYQATQLLGGTSAVRSELVRRTLGRERWLEIGATQIRNWLEKITGHPMIQPLPS